MKIKKEQLDRLTRGKRSGAATGSRKVGHRLSQLERAAFERAKEMKCLLIGENQRLNLCNVWEKYCDIMKIEELVLIREKTGMAQIRVGSRLLFQGSLSESKAFINQKNGKL